jgi:hypothetical protein
MLSEWKIVPGAKRPDPNEMTDFNVLTMNAKAYPGTAPLVCRKGERVRIRFGNLSAMDHHPIHLHGYYFKVVATDGGALPVAAQWPETTVLVPVGSTRDVEFVADEPGDWAMHCHMTHHVMNQMGHELPNMIGVDTGKVGARGRPARPRLHADGPARHGRHGRDGHACPEEQHPDGRRQGPLRLHHDGRHVHDREGARRGRRRREQGSGLVQAPARHRRRPRRKEDMDRDGIKV